MKLTDINAAFLRAHGEDRYSFVRFDCPCGCRMRAGVSFTPALDGSAVPEERKNWQRVSGDTLETITLTPSILLEPDPNVGCKGWHGFLQNGELRTC